MATQRCTHCYGRGKLTQCDICHKDCGPNGPFVCAYCEAEICRECHTVNEHHQVICPTHDKKIKVDRGGHYVNSPQWDGL